MGDKMPGFLYGADEVEAWERSKPPDCPHCASLRARLESAEQERAKLREFKEFCHLYLDAHGVPHHPPGTHGAEGCRIGDRLDWILAHRDRLESVEAARRDAQESRFALIVQNEELGADLVAIRARLESTEAALRKLLRYHTMRWEGEEIEKCSLCGLPISEGRHEGDCPFAALAAVGERESRSDG